MLTAQRTVIAVASTVQFYIGFVPSQTPPRSTASGGKDAEVSTPVIRDQACARSGERVDRRYRDRRSRGRGEKGGRGGEGDYVLLRSWEIRKQIKMRRKRQREKSKPNVSKVMNHSVF